MPLNIGCQVEVVCVERRHIPLGYGVAKVGRGNGRDGTEQRLGRRAALTRMPSVAGMKDAVRTRLTLR